MIMTVQTLQRIEGSARLTLSQKEGEVINAQLDFDAFRAFETMLESKKALDALVLTPRICGICGHAHLNAAVQAIENIYECQNMALTLSPKAKILRDLCLGVELLQNHLKWFFLFLRPELPFLSPTSVIHDPLVKEMIEEVHQLLGVISLIAGQWPHNAFVVPGGVTSSPTPLDKAKIEAMLYRFQRYLEKNLFGCALHDVNHTLSFSGVLGEFFNTIHETPLKDKGCTRSPFLVAGLNNGFKQGFLSHGMINDFMMKGVSTYTTKSGMKRGVYYQKDFAQTGPLSRCLVKNHQSISQLYQTYSDSFLTRTMARMLECADVLLSLQSSLINLHTTEDSFIPPRKKIETLSGEGVGIIEAPRGTLIHRVILEKGMIQKYEVITPTLWNLSSYSAKKQGVGIQAIVDAKESHLSSAILRSFDICSACVVY